MNQLIPFQFHTHAVRVIPHENGISFWVVAKDVADALGYSQAKDFLRQVPDKHKGRQKVPTIDRGLQEMTLVDEAGLYRGVLRSNKPEAEPFVEWVTAEVLPSIRRTGGYTAAEPQFPPVLTPEQYEAERDRLEMMQARLADTPIVMTSEDYDQLTGARLRVGKKVYLVAELVGILEHHGIPRKVAQELTGLNNNAIRQHAWLSRQGRGAKGGAA